MSQKDSLNDDLLLQRVKEGDSKAFERIYDRYWKAMYLSAFKILIDESLAEDVVHDVFVSVWNKRAQISIENVKSYLFTATRNGAISKLRHIKFLKVHDEAIKNLAIATEPIENFDKKALIKSVMTIIEALPRRCKEIFILSRIEGHSISEIAEKLNISHRTVENQLHIALKYVRDTLGKDYRNL